MNLEKTTCNKIKLLNMRTKRLIVSSLTLSLLINVTSCIEKSSKKDSDELVSAYASGTQSEEELEAELKKIQEEEEEARKIELANMTSLAFDKLEFDYGNVAPETENTTYFEVKNTGDKPLIIEKVEASCGCTTPEKPEAPILPGKTDKIKVVFKSKPGQKGEQHKTVTVTANTDPKINTLKIKAFVK